jgi:hypothetical protein
LKGVNLVSAMGDDNFGNNGARAYLSVLAAKLVATINEIDRDRERLRLDEDGESMFMPSVELLALLIERYALEPPRPEAVKRWRDRYLKMYDATVASYNPDPEFQVSRRRTIDNTFRWLLSLAESYWEQ